jgi:purine nucleosidase
MTATHRVIFDTDIGTDVDDILALGVLLGSPEVQLEAVTTVYGDVDLRARMVQRVLQLRGRDDVPVHTGIREPLLGLDPVYWPGHEGVGLLEEATDLPGTDPTHAVDTLVERVLASPGEITLLAVGPLTNVAAALVRAPELATALKRLVIMGGKVQLEAHPWAPAEHNIKCDPEAAHIVFRSGAPIELVPLDVTLRTVIRAEGVAALEAVGTPYHAALADQVRRLPAYTERGQRTYLHDPLAALAVIQPDLLGWTPLHLEVAREAGPLRGATIGGRPDARHPVTAQTALDLDVAACEKAIASRLAS